MEEQLNELETLKTHCDEYLAGWKRAQADYANLKKETEKEKAEYAKFANERLLASLLPAVDQYEIALSHTPDISTLPEEDQKRLKNWLIGLHAVKALWEEAFRGIGLDKVQADIGDAFDPSIHEAVGEEEGSDQPHGHIHRISQQGWRLHDKLLRPAKVILAINKDE